MHTVTKTIKISASHCIKDHIKCSRMHGHNYKIKITVGAETPINNGMLIDFGDLSKILAEVFNKYDHQHLGILPEGWSSNPNHVVNLPFEYTTSENLSAYWGKEVESALLDFDPLKLIKIEVYETSESVATWQP